VGGIEIEQLHRGGIEIEKTRRLLYMDTDYQCKVPVVSYCTLGSVKIFNKSENEKEANSDPLVKGRIYVQIPVVDFINLSMTDCT
jgi:hypothetical protein